MLALIGYIAFSLLAIGGLAFMLHKMGQSERFKLVDEAAAQKHFLAEFPDANIEQVVLSPDNSAALLAISPDAIGLVRSMGRFPVMRKISQGGLEQAQCVGAAITLHMRDFADPKFKIILAEEKIAAHWQQLIEERCHA